MPRNRIARLAREVEQAVDSNPARPIPADPNQSEAILSLRHEQQRVFDQEARDRQRQIDLENLDRLRQEEQQRQCRLALQCGTLEVRRNFGHFMWDSGVPGLD
jgi:hypothetical protein